MPQSRSNHKVIKFHKPIRMNVGIIIFIVIFIYVILHCVLYFTKSSVKYYEVTEGTSASKDYIYRGLALRNEKISYANEDGYINYYVREGNRVSLNSTLYTLDNSGNVSDLLKKASDNQSVLSNSDFRNLQNDMNSFAADYSSMEFSQIYDFQNTLEASILQLVNANSLDSLQKNLKSSGASLQIKRAASSGIIVYSVDGYETKKDTDITNNDFDLSKYNKASFKSNMQVHKGDPIYKTINDETWEIMIPMTTQDVRAYAKINSVNVKFLKDGLKAKASFRMQSNQDQIFGILTLDKYMLRYAKDRYLSIQITAAGTEGLKIPKTAVLQKSFYIIPVDFATVSTDSQTISFNLQKESDKGNVTVTRIEPDIYSKTDKYYYIDTNELSYGDVLIKSNSNETYTVGQTESVSGVYCINNGYTQFRKIDTITDSNDYYIIQDNSSYGLRLYDHILLDVTSGKYKENQILSN